MSIIELRVEGIERALSVRHFAIRESVSELFSVSVVACSPRADLDWEELILRPASLAINAGWAFVKDGGCRTYTGVCASIEQIQAEPSGLSTYALGIVPRLWLLTERETCRIFQHLTIPEILARILDESSIAHLWRIDRSIYPKLNYKVQFNESDFAFLSRLCEEAGLTFFFEEDEAKGSVLVLADAPSSGTPREASPLTYVDNPNAASEREYVTCVRVSRSARAGAAALGDYDFRSPVLPLHGVAASSSDAESQLEKYCYQPGSFRCEAETTTSTPIADRAGVARGVPRYGVSRAEHVIQGSRAKALGIAFTTNALDLAPGVVFSMAGHPHPRLDEANRLLVTELAVEGDHDKEWVATGRAVFTDTPYRPPQRTRKPFIFGAHTAIVTGPKDREIFSDEYGRVRVQFPWDREGKHDGESSCWIRVVQGWAGPTYGLWTVPRVGQEVLVSFLSGDPDEPIIVGRVANAHNPPPYSMPENETKTVWRSKSTPRSDGFNEISFEDRKGEELLYERAERDRESITRNDERLLVGRNRSRVVKGEEDIAVLRDRRELIGGDDHRTVNGDERERTKGGRSSIINEDWHVHVSDRLLIEAGGEILLSSETKIVLSAPDITLDTGGGFLRAIGAGVAIDGPAVTIQAGGAPASGAASQPALPELPGGVRGVFGTPGLPLQKRLPMFPSGPGVAGNVGVDYERSVICRAICICDGAHNGRQRVSQWCVTLALWEYDHVFGYQSTIKAEVFYDMSQSPPVPTMSKNDPRRPTRRRLGGTESPDVVLLYDGTKPPTQDNIKKVYEIKFGKDKLDPDKRDTYTRIAGSNKKFEVLRPEDCDCPEKKTEPLPSPISAKDAAKLVILALAAIAVLLLPVPGKGRAAVALVRRLLLQLAPLLARLKPVPPPPMAPPL